MNITITNPGEIEDNLAHSAELAVIEAQSITIIDNIQYGLASQLLVEHKQRIKAVKDYWEKPKTIAKAAHQEICDKEKAMLAPFTQAETIIKAAMVNYQRKVEDERRAAEMEARKRQQEEAERLLAEVIKAEKAGNITRANAVMAMATTIDEMPVFSDVAAPKAAGVSTKKTWKARVTDTSLVPAYHSGIELRIINQSALNTIARLSNGGAAIPGVEFFEDISISARA